MSNNISIQAVSVARTGNDSAADAKMAANTELPPQAEPVPPPSPIINPTLRLDAALGLVVIEFRNNSGAITTSIPSERQIAAYQRWAQTHSTGPPRDGAAASGAALTQQGNGGPAVSGS